MSTRVLAAKFGKSKANLPATESWQRSDCTTASAGWSGSLHPLVFKAQKKHARRGANTGFVGAGGVPACELAAPCRVPWGAQRGLVAGSSRKFEQPCKAVSFLVSGIFRRLTT